MPTNVGAGVIAAYQVDIEVECRCPYDAVGDRGGDVWVPPCVGNAPPCSFNAAASVQLATAGQVLFAVRAAKLIAEAAPSEPARFGRGSYRT
jgi:hypothetical protein